MYTPRGRARAARPRGRPAGSPRRRAAPASLRREPLAQRRRRHVERRELLDQPLDPRRVGLGVDAVDRRHPSRSSNSATCSLVRIISRSISRWASVCGDAVGAERRCPLASKLELRLGANRPRGWSAPRCSPSAAATSRATPSGSADRRRRRARGRRRSRRAGRSRGGRRSGCGCGRSGPSAASPPAPSSISAVTASRSTPGVRLQASLLSACGSIGSTAPGT